MKLSRFAIIVVIMLQHGCKKIENEVIVRKEVLRHDFNLILVPDLSNRIDANIYPKPVHDTLILKSVFAGISDIFLHLESRTMNQKDRYKVDFLNPDYLNNPDFDANDFMIDFSVFETDQLARIDYIKDSLPKDIKEVNKNVCLLYEKASKKTSGAEIYNYLNALVNESLDEHEPRRNDLVGSNETIITTPKNVVVLFTDGYIENTYDKKGYSLGNEEIVAIRKAYEANGASDIEQFITDHPEFQLTPLNNPKLSQVNLLVMEMYDRSLVKGVPTQRPTDIEIIKAVWKNWLGKSNLGDFDFVRTQNTPERAVDELRKFMERKARKNINPTHA